MLQYSVINIFNSRKISRGIVNGNELKNQVTLPVIVHRVYRFSQHLLLNLVEQELLDRFLLDAN